MMNNKEKNFVSAVIYVHNAENRLEKFLKEVISVMENNFEYSEIICVNDCSDDNSLKVIREVSGAARTTSVSVINMSCFHGLEVAMIAGMDLSIGDFVFEFDNTVLDYEKDVIIDIYRRALQGYDIVSAAPNRKGKYTSRLFYKVFERFTDLSYKMHTESVRVLSRRAINRVKSLNKTIPYRKAIYASAGLKNDTVFYHVTSDMTLRTDRKESRYRAGLAVNSLILFTEVGYRFAIAMTVLMMLISVFMVIYSAVVYVTAHPVAGWTTTIMFLSVAFSGLFGILTIVIKYIQILVNLVFKRQQYSFESIEKLTQ